MPSEIFHLRYSARKRYLPLNTQDCSETMIGARISERNLCTLNKNKHLFISNVVLKLT